MSDATPQALRVLLIEDSDNDALLLVHTLKQAGFACAHQRVETEAALRTALAEHPWDAILSDFSLPGFSGLEALWLVRAQGLTLPFIFVSGSVEESMIAQAMRDGAHDYVMKDNLTRLPVALRRELDAAADRRRNQFQGDIHRSILDTAPDAIITVDAQKQIGIFNRAAEQIFGYAAVDVQGQSLSLLLPSLVSILQPSETPGRAVEASAAQSHFETVARRKGGAEFVTEVNVSTVICADSAYCTLMLRDVSERKELERQRALGEQRLRLLTSSIKDYAVILLDPQGLVLSWNDGAEQIKGYRADEIVGRSWVVFYTPADIAAGRHEALREQARAEGRAEAQGWRVRKDGRQFFAEVVISAIRDDSGALLGYSKVTRDITQRREMQMALMRQHEELEQRVQERTAELEDARASAETLAVLKSEFLSNMSHELRTPLNAVLGLAYLLERQELLPDALALVKKIGGAGRLLLAIINDILDITKIDAGRLTLELAPFDLSEVIDTVATVMTSSAAGKQLELVIVPPASGVRHLRGDALRLGQVLINLASNAVKFTAQGFVELKIEVAETGIDRVVLRFSVRDSGIGMEVATQARIFDPFSQADATITRRFGGTGLGLSISSKLVAMMGGKLAVQSTPGVGSTFSFTLGFDLHELAQQAMQDLRDMTVLVVDDNPITLEGMCATVGSLGWEVHGLRSGRQALQQVLADERLHGVNGLVLLDWQMTDLDGDAVARAIAEALPPSQRPLLFLVTSHAGEVADLDLDGCCDAVMFKPLLTSTLYDQTVRARKRRTGGLLVAPTMLPTQSIRLKGVRLLVVDDSEINREVASRIMGDEGARVSTACNGREALELLKAHPADFDLVLMDVQMPEMDGNTATRLIRQDPALVSLPVVAMTAGTFEEQRQAARDAGMSGFVAKPFDVDDTVTLIRDLVGVVDDDEGAPAPASAKQCRPQPDADGLQALLDVDAGLAIFKSPDTYRKTLRHFTDELKLMAVCQEAHRGDPGACEARAHKLRGAAGNLGLRRLAALATKAESALHRGADAEDAMARLLACAADTHAAIIDYAGAAEAPTADADAPQATPMAEVKALLVRTLGALNTDSPAPVEALLVLLTQAVPPAELIALRQALDDFDFRAGERAVYDLAALHGLTLEQ